LLACGSGGSEEANRDGGSNGDGGLTVATGSAFEPAGENCEFGGMYVETGGDDDGDGLLDDDEVEEGEYQCNVPCNDCPTGTLDPLRDLPEFCARRSPRTLSRSFELH